MYNDIAIGISAGIIFLLIGIIIFLKPDLIWKLTESWKSQQADGPSDFYLKSTKFGGILLGILGIVLMILSFVLR